MNTHPITDQTRDPEVRFRSASVSDTPGHQLRVEGELEVAGHAVRFTSNPRSSRPTINWTSR